MHITFKSTNIELTPTLRDYTEKKLQVLEKFSKGNGQAAVELEKTTNHHKQGDIFRAEANVTLGTGAQYRAVSEKEDLYEAIDDMKDELVRELTAGKGKERALWKRGALAVKGMMRGSYEVIKGFRFRKRK
ncbi:MAG TPA: ribosome-associated translation inhibitor RaiA [Candidatus Paceibacterota bacterium]|nr:ribosome-associated translation inhibitor RaiA [Candidatus Paceibacterota bacterium]